MRADDIGRRGAPLVLLVSVIGLWVAGRGVATYLPPWMPIETTVADTRSHNLPGSAASRNGRRAAASAPVGPAEYIADIAHRLSGGVISRRAASAVARPLGLAANRLSPQFAAQLPGTIPAVPEVSRPYGATVTGNGTVPTSQDRVMEYRVEPASAGIGPTRWTGDAWLFLREGEVSPQFAGRPSYGSSQAGATLRYRLGRATAASAMLHVRASSALAGGTDREIAVGASARPVEQVPVRLVAEGRLRDSALGTETRAAVYAYTELPPFELATGTTGEIYAQAGYVGGEFATPFADGQARIARRIAARGTASLEVGAGAWAGAQRGSERVDVGPTIATHFSAGRIYGRLSADYRFRVAGSAEPASGPALTLSAGF